jgi:hypothetical protein
MTQNLKNESFLSYKGLVFRLMFSSHKLICIALLLIFKHERPILHRDFHDVNSQESQVWFIGDIYVF